MLRKLFCGLMAAGMLFATSCQQQEFTPALGEATVTFEVATPEIATRAYSDGMTANQLQYAVYHNGVKSQLTCDPVTVTNGKAYFKQSLTAGETYTIILWADHDKAPYTVSFGQAIEETTMTVDYSGVKSNDENLDAFYAVKEFTVNGAQTETVELRRPFAQLNIGTNDYDEALTASNYQPTKSSVTVSHVNDVMNLYTGEVQGDVTVEFKSNDLATGNFPVADYEYVAMNYVLVRADKSLVDVVFTISDNNNNNKTRTVSSVPVQRNYRTNIYGSILTSDVDVNVEIKPGYDGTTNVSVWDGVTLLAPKFENNIYEIYEAAELAYIAQLVNGTLDTDNVSTRAAVAANSLKGCTIKLMNDIDLAGEEWTPIGNGGNHFQGTLDGNEHIIHGLKVAERRDTRAALIGTVSGTVAFRNLTIKGASIVCPDFDGDFYGSALIGTAYGNVTIENVDVIDSYISGNNKVGALLAHDGVVSSLKITDCDVYNTTFEALNIEDGGSVGGLVGYFQGVAKGTQAAPYGEHVISNSTVKNCTFNVVNSTNTGKRANGQLMGGLDSKAGQELYITDCTIENNTWNETFYEDGRQVTENTFVSPYGAWIGGERNDVPEGKVIIDGVEVVAPGIGKEIDQNDVETYVVTAAEGLEWIASQLSMKDENDQFINTFEGVTIKLATDIDLSKMNEDGEPICFDPIGSYRFDQVFKGTFDGQDHTIKNLNQNTWALDNGYYYNDCGLGLFGALDEATIKNLKIDNASISGESALCGIVAAVAQNSTFENITVTNSQCADYQYYAGGIVGWVSGDNNNFINCKIDESTTIAAQWGDFDNSVGGIIGGASASAKIYMKDCVVAGRIDAYNDVTSSYQWYAYRRCGMLIGNSGATETIDGRTVATAPQLTCENVTVQYGDWMNYTYCEFAGTSWPYVRVQAGISNSAYSNPRYGHPTDADGIEVVDDNHVHNEGEDHHLLLAFDQLYGGGQGVYGARTHEGVTVNYPESFFREQGYKQQENTYTIYSGEGFKHVATNVLNDGTKNVTIELANDIDLDGIEWPAVKTAAAFVLDGKGHSIKNLTTTAVEDHGFYSTAMFTSTRKATTIKNLVVEDATVTGKGGDNSHGAVLVACNYASLNIERVTVKKSTISNCDRSSALVTYLYFTTATVKDCVVEDCTVNSIGTAGAILGMNNSHNFTMTGNTVKNTTISSSEGSNKAGILIGTWQDAGTLTESGNEVENSKAINAGTETNNNIGRHA